MIFSHSLGYSEAAKSRLLRKYGGNRREIQCHVDELIKNETNQRRKCQRIGKVCRRARAGRDKSPGPGCLKYN